MKIIEAIKKRLGKNTKKRIYIQDKELMDTAFVPGEKYSYLIDIKNNKMIISPSLDLDSTEQSNTDSNVITGERTVSKRKVQEGVKPVLDIRDTESISKAFPKSEYLQITIYKEEIIIEGYNKEEENSNSANSTSKLIDIKSLVRCKQTFKTIAPSYLIKAVGDEFSPEQITFDSFVQDNKAFTVDNSYSSMGISGEGSLQSRINEAKKVEVLVKSLFSASGMMDYGFKQAGFDFVFAIDNDKGACESYKHNIGDHIVNSDIRELDKLSLPKSDIIIGGVPCKPFSNANRGVSRLDEHKDSDLVLEFIKTIKEDDNCKVFVMENTPAVLSASNSKYLNLILDSLGDFEITYSVLNDAEMGGFQASRERAFIIGSKIGKIDIPKKIISDKSKFKTIRECFLGLTPDTPNNEDRSKNNQDTINRMSYVPQGGNFEDIPEDFRTKGKHSNSYRRLAWDEPAYTIVNPRKVVMMPPEGNVGLSVRECARIQGMPDDFIYKGTLASKQQQVCDGVPLSLSKAIAGVVMKAFEKYNKRNGLKIVSV